MSGKGLRRRCKRDGSCRHGAVSADYDRVGDRERTSGLICHACLGVARRQKNICVCYIFFYFLSLFFLAGVCAVDGGERTTDFCTEIGSDRPTYVVKTTCRHAR